MNTIRTVGPFTVLTLPTDSSLATGPHGLEKVPKGKKTSPHSHNFLSLYLAIGLTLVSDGETYMLPERALVVVPPEIDHSWVPTNEIGFVGSVDTRHEPQELIDQ